MGAAIACLFFLLDERRTVGHQQLLGSLLATGVVVAMVVIWPWYSVVNSSTGPEVVSHLHARLYQQPFAKCGLVLIAIPVLVYRLLTRLMDAMTLTVIACFGILVFGAVTGDYYLSRALPTAVLLAQVSVGRYQCARLGCGRPGPEWGRQPAGALQLSGRDGQELPPGSTCARAAASLRPSPTIDTPAASILQSLDLIDLVGWEHIGDHLLDADLSDAESSASPVRTGGQLALTA